MLWYFQVNSRWAAKGLSHTYTCIHLLKFPSHPGCHITLHAYILTEDITAYCCCSITQSCPTLCNPMDCSKPHLPVHQQLPEFTQTHVHWVGDVINLVILCRPLLLPPSIFPSIRVFSSESVLCIRWPKYWSFSVSLSPFNEHPGLISFRMDWLDLLAVQGTLKSLLQHHSSKGSILWAQLSL